MRKLLSTSAAVLAIAGATLGAAAPAEARYHGGRYYGGYHHHGGGRTALALGAGILGLAAGAAIVDNRRAYRSYAPAYYGGGPAYYGGAPAYYDGGYGYDRGPDCRTDFRWDRYAQRYVRVESCG